MLRVFRVSCIDIRDAAATIIEYIAGLDWPAFARSKLHQDAVIREFLVIGEAANRIPEKVRNQYGHILWHKMIGMRNRMVHGYDQISLETVWHTASHFIPEVKRQFDELLASPELQQ